MEDSYEIDPGNKQNPQWPLTLRLPLIKSHIKVTIVKIASNAEAVRDWVSLILIWKHNHQWHAMALTFKKILFYWHYWDDSQQQLGFLYSNKIRSAWN